MPTKHVEIELWTKIEEITVATIMQTKTMVKDTDILQEVIRKGLQHISVEELVKFVQKEMGK